METDEEEHKNKFNQKINRNSNIFSKAIIEEQFLSDPYNLKKFKSKDKQSFATFLKIPP